jgi:hypothetical protein
MLRILLIFFLLFGGTYLSASVSEDEVLELYVGTFNRAADANGLKYWKNDALDTQEEQAIAFFESPEAQYLYPKQMSATELVNEIYKNLFNRNAELAGLAYWVGELSEGRVSRSEMLLAIMEGATDSQEGNDKTTLQNKVEVGGYYADNGLNSITYARTVMAGVTDDYYTVLTAKSSIDEFVGIVYDYSGDWSGTSQISVTKLSFYCKWDVSLHVNENNTGEVESKLISNSGDQGDCQAYTKSYGYITNKSENGFTFIITKTDAEFIYGGNTFNLQGNYSKVSELLYTTVYGHSATRDTTLSKVENSNPIANAGDDQNVITGSTVMLNGSNSSDANGDLLTYSWSLINVPIGSHTSLKNSTSVKPTFVADVDGTYVIQLTVNDGTVDSSPDTIVVNATTDSEGEKNYPVCNTEKIGSYYRWNHKDYLVVDRSLADDVIAGKIAGVTVGDICTSQITDMSYMFNNNSTFNQSLSNWDTVNVTVMSYMISWARSFNLPLN